MFATARDRSPPSLESRKAPATFFSKFPFLPALLLFLLELAELLLVSPRIRLLEASICRSHYQAVDPSVIPPTGIVPENLCKLEPIQARLAHIRGWQVFCEAIPVMALAVPWGALADRVGRKKVLMVNFLGCALHILWFVTVCHPHSTLPAEAVWASGLAFVLGGGPRTGGIMVLALVTDSSVSKKRSERFYYTYSAFLITELLAPPLSAALMTAHSSLLVPFAVALLSLALAVPVLLSIRAQHPRRASRPSSPVSSPLLGASSTTGPAHLIKSSLSSFISPNLACLLFLHFLCPTRQELTFQILIPYTSLTFSLPIRRAGLLLSVIAVSNLIAITAVLPYVSRLLTRRNISPLRIDAVTAKGSCLLLAASCVVLGITRDLGVFTMGVVAFAAGFGVRLAVLSAVTKVVDETNVGKVFGAVTVLEGAGEMVSAVVLQRIWVAGMEKGAGSWGYGAVWWIGAGVYCVGAIVVDRVRG